MARSRVPPHIYVTPAVKDIAEGLAAEDAAAAGGVPRNIGRTVGALILDERKRRDEAAELQKRKVPV